MTRHPLSVAGAWLATLGAFAFILVFLADLLGVHHNPYFGLLAFVLLPMVFVAGLILIPIGIVLARRREAKGLAPYTWPRIDLNDPLHRRNAVAVLALTFANVLIVSLAANRGLEYMDSPQFCGQVCHTVMEPEFAAHSQGPHSRINCVDCHVGSGAGAFAYYKLNGLRQLAHLATGHYPKPIPSPVFNLRPSRDTCETCHAPAKFHGDKVNVVAEYGSDEKNTEKSTKLLMHVGGGLPEYGLGAGIHWHTNPNNEIDFVATDAKRQEIPYVRLKRPDGTVLEFRTENANEAQIAAAEPRRMDCVDCHNRPTHQFFASPERAVDEALARGAIPTSIPFVRREAVKVLSATYPDRATAEREIAAQLRAFYRGSDAAAGAAQAPAAGQATGAVQGQQVEQLIKTAQFVYSRSVFPAMNVSWGTYQNNVGHTDSMGCFRCHDDQHKTKEGTVIRQDCSLCHDIQ